MIQYTKHILDNGLTVLIHEDQSTPLVTINMLVKAGSRNERPERTGFAHLFEHLMFGGTRLVPDYDRVVDLMGGESNAFTNNDFTNFYLTVPAANLEEALSLEADRMHGDWDTDGEKWHSLDVQKSVVTEEYHQRYKNQAYGDAWMLLRALSYKVHPYRWCTIGADIQHVAEASLEDVRNFFNEFYRMDNTILAIAGNVKQESALKLVNQTFGRIKNGAPVQHCPIPVEPEQTEAREQIVFRPVPNNALYITYPMCGRLHHDFYTYDTISDILSNGESSRMHTRLIRELGLFTELNASISGDYDPGTFNIVGKIRDGISVDQAKAAIEHELSSIVCDPIDEHELEKVVNKYENTFVYSQYKAADRAQNLCYFESLGQIELINDEPLRYRDVTPNDIQRIAESCFQAHHMNVLQYLKETK